jgi:hypothetical protein
MVELWSVAYESGVAKRLWDRLGLIAILDTINRLSRIT